MLDAFTKNCGTPERWSKEMYLDVLNRRKAGETLESISKSYSVSRARIRQIVEKALHLIDKGLIKS